MYIDCLEYQKIHCYFFFLVFQTTFKFTDKSERKSSPYEEDVCATLGHVLRMDSKRLVLSVKFQEIVA